MASPSEQPGCICCAVVELRPYALHPGQRDVLIELFDREFVESQEAAGMRVIGQFRDLDDPDRFIWLRGFPGMDARAESLTAFYSGPIWRAHRDVAFNTQWLCHVREAPVIHGDPRWSCRRNGPLWQELPRQRPMPRGYRDLFIRRGPEAYIRACSLKANDRTVSPG